MFTGKIERRISGEQRHGMMGGIASLQTTDDLKGVCPYYAVKTALCRAALESTMIAKRNCFKANYKACSIFSVNESRGR